MPNNIVNIELRSEEVQEILTRVPRKLLRYGSTVILVILVIVLFLSWLIKYPNLVTAPVSITTTQPPEKLIAKSSGKIQAIFVNDKSIVTPNTVLAVLENSADYKAVFQLKTILDVYNFDKEFPFQNFNGASLGEIETSYAMFQKEYQANELNKKLQPYQVDKSAQSLEQVQLQDRLQLLLSQKEISELELQLQKQDLQRYESLFKKGVISSQEYEKNKLVFLQAQKNFKNLQSSISQTKSALNELNKSQKTTVINENKETVTLNSNLNQAFFQLKKAIKEWELNYAFVSKNGGIVSFMQIWSVNQNITGGEILFSVVPQHSSAFIAKVKAPAQNAGKIKVGQNVNIRLMNYPDNEFGILKGKVQNMSLVPDKDGNLILDVVLSHGLKTSYHKKIVFQQEMSGTADIITEDLRLIERIFNQFRSLYKVE
ncbi:HlyD family secretion protein [Flavobacterium sp.]|jgi:multidrug resistance efflux pump|uniref:HlyD family secretion protein n=1 Tax=Flavobacterium sp. TaxID=239 RepID=UPI0037BEFF27